MQFSTTDAFGGGIGGFVFESGHGRALCRLDLSGHFNLFPGRQHAGSDQVPGLVGLGLPRHAFRTHSVGRPSRCGNRPAPGYRSLFRGNPDRGVVFDSNQVINATDAEAQPYLGGGITVDSWTDSIQFNMSVDNILVVSPLAQDVSFAALADQTYGNAPFALAATASSGLPVNFSVISGPASINSNIVTLTGAGLVTGSCLATGRRHLQCRG